MRGYTTKVGLRKSRLHFDTLLARKIVRRVPDDDWSWVRHPGWWCAAATWHPYLEVCTCESGDGDPCANPGCQ